MSEETPVVGPETGRQIEEFINLSKPPLVSREQVEVMIGKLAIGTASQKRSVAEEAERLSLYWLALRKYPLVDLHEAFETLLKTSKYMPGPAEVAMAADNAGVGRKRRVSRAKWLLYKHRTEYSPPKQYLTREELEKLKAEEPGLAGINTEQKGDAEHA